MSKPTLTIFANFRINNEERYQRMKDSFDSFKDINAQKWVINVRGSYKLKTILFLRENLGEKLYPHLIESGKGWFYDTKSMLHQIDTDFVFFWIEDHINMTDIKKYDNILLEMKKNEVDNLLYSWWHDGTRKILKYINGKQTNNLNIYDMSLDNVHKIEKNIRRPFYIVSAVSISSLKFFSKIINTDHPKLKRWPKKTPFDFEKKSTDTKFLPFNFALPKCELFASIDDDNGAKGYSLINRRQYHNRLSREQIKSNEYGKKRLFFLKKHSPLLLRKVYRLILKIKYSIGY